MTTKVLFSPSSEIEHLKKRAWLKEFANNPQCLGMIHRTCACAKIASSTFYKWLHEDPLSRSSSARLGWLFVVPLARPLYTPLRFATATPAALTLAAGRSARSAAWSLRSSVHAHTSRPRGSRRHAAAGEMIQLPAGHGLYLAVEDVPLKPVECRPLELQTMSGQQSAPTMVLRRCPEKSMALSAEPYPQPPCQEDVEAMDEAAITRYITDTFGEGVDAVVASQEAGAPEVAWGDTFFIYDPDRNLEPKHRFPFATIVTKDYGEFDRASNLNRPSVFRLNIGVSKDTYRSLFGPQPSSPGAAGVVDTGHDFAALDRLMPHPVYAPQSWVCVLNPSETTFQAVRPLLAEAYDLAVKRRAKAVSDLSSIS